jgi:hypothetical protein
MATLRHVVTAALRLTRRLVDGHHHPSASLDPISYAVELERAHDLANGVTPFPLVRPYREQE